MKLGREQKYLNINFVYLPYKRVTLHKIIIFCGVFNKINIKKFTNVFSFVLNLLEERFAFKNIIQNNKLQFWDFDESEPEIP